MIVANLASKNAAWLAESTAFKPVLNFLQETDLTSLSLGRHDITADIYANVQEYNTKAEADGRWESHVQYVDFQFIQSGTEYVRVHPASALTVKTNALAEKDAYYYEKHSGKATDILLKANDFAILFPEDAHEACLNVDQVTPVRKLVIKVPVKLLN